MEMKLTELLEAHPIESSAPCRIDMGGTLDIRTFYFPLSHLSPCTFNIALNLRTHVRLHPWTKGYVKISSKGFENAEFPIDEVPFKHPMGLMFAIAAYFRASGVHIEIESGSPVRSALGGSSAAAIAIVAAFSECLKRKRKRPLTRYQIAAQTYSIEESVAGVPCGVQDHLAATFGGINAWYWPTSVASPPFAMKPVVLDAEATDLEKHLLLAYCGVPHESRDINGQWVHQFLGGQFRKEWHEIVSHTQAFVKALARRNFPKAAKAMNAEVLLRKQMTPDVLDDIGDALVQTATAENCGARFTGAGGGGCIWAISKAEAIEKLKPEWEQILAKRPGAQLLDVKIDTNGVTCRHS